MAEKMNAVNGVSLCRWQRVEDTMWPVPSDSLDWVMRYGSVENKASAALCAASVIHAYSYLCDPALTQTQAIAALKRARTAHRAPPIALEPERENGD